MGGVVRVEVLVVISAWARSAGSPASVPRIAEVDPQRSGVCDGPHLRHQGGVGRPRRSGVCYGLSFVCRGNKGLMYLLMSGAKSGF